MIDLDNEARRLVSITVEEHKRLLAIERKFFILTRRDLHLGRFSHVHGK